MGLPPPRVFCKRVGKRLIGKEMREYSFLKSATRLKKKDLTFGDFWKRMKRVKRVRRKRGRGKPRPYKEEELKRGGWFSRNMKNFSMTVIYSKG